MLVASAGIPFGILILVFDSAVLQDFLSKYKLIWWRQKIREVLCVAG